MALPQLLTWAASAIQGMFPVQTSAGVDSAGSIPALNSEGAIDPSMLPASAITWAGPQTFESTLTQTPGEGANNKTPFLQASDLLGDYVVEGLLTAVPSSASLTGTLAAGTAYVIGQRTVLQADVNYTYTASSDTYVDLSYSGTLTYLEVATGSAAPAVTANSLRLQMVVTSATAITSVSQLAPIQPTIAGFVFGYGNGNTSTNYGIGYKVLASNTTGYNNMGVGHNVLPLNTTGAGNLGVGYRSLYNNTTGSQNIAFGSEALQGNISGGGNVAFGGSAGMNLTSGYNCIFIGPNSQPLNDYDSSETVIGGNQTGYGSNTATIAATSGLMATGPIYATGSSIGSLSLGSTTTAGDITITAAEMVGGFFADGATQTAAFTVSTDTAANILAALPLAQIGSAFKFRFFNNDQSTLGYDATLAAGTDVTISTTLPNPAVPKGSWCDYLCVFTAIGSSPAITVTAVGMGTTF